VSQVVVQPIKPLQMTEIALELAF